MLDNTIMFEMSEPRLGKNILTRLLCNACVYRSYSSGHWAGLVER